MIWLSSSLSALKARVAVLEGRAKTRGRGTLGTTIAIASTVAVPVTFDKEMPNANYEAVQLQLEGTIGVGSAFPVLPLAAKTTTGCTVNVRNPGVTVIGSGLTVVVTVEVM